MKYDFWFRSSSLSVFEKIKQPFLAVGRFVRNLAKSYHLMPRWERVLALVLTLTALALVGLKIFDFYKERTVLVPATGGAYTEAIVGDIKYLSPILAQSDAEKSISSLIFPGLIKISDASTVAPDLAERYEISPDGKKYTFYLRDKAVFSDGVAITAADVAFTIDNIKAPESKSHFARTWENVTVTVVDDQTITLDLPAVYGPFVYNCDFGIIPAHLSSDEFSKKLIGAGPYRYVKSTKDGSRVSEIDLERNSSYFGSQTYVEKVNFLLFQNKDDASREYEKNNDVNGLFGADSPLGLSKSYQSTKQLGLIYNLKSDKLSDLAVRTKIDAGEKLDQELQLTLTSLDMPLQRDRAEKIKASLAGQNIKVQINYLDSLKYQDVLTQRSYELLLYGFDLGADRDPYVFWHSSQLSSLNLAGWSDKKSDILLEDARMVVDPVARNSKYDQFYDIIKANHLAVYYDPISYSYHQKKPIPGFGTISGNQVTSRFDQIASWYFKQKRVRK